MDVSVVVPTRGRPAYLEVTLGSVAAQARAAGAQLLVVSDGPDDAAAEVARRHAADYMSLPAARGLNAARNVALSSATGELIAFIDDDVEVPDAWLEALLAGVRAAPEHGVFGGPLHARLEGGGPRCCGREPPPISTLDLGPEDQDAPFVWGANMAIRASAAAQVGPFDESIFVRGDEEEWQRRYLAQGGRIRYVAAAGLVHRRTPADSRLRRLVPAAYGHGRAARRFDARKGTEPALSRELRVLAGCAWHTIRRRCAFGIVLGAQAAGRLREAAAGRGS